MPVTSRTLYLAPIALLCGVAMAQNPTTQPMPTQPTQPNNPAAGAPGYPGMPATDTPAMDMRVDDKAFLKKAAEVNMTQVELGKLAEEKGSSPAVKEFGKHMVEDHTKANEELAATASKVNAEVPTDLSGKGKKTREKLAKLSGPDFDKAYAKQMVNDHREDVQSFTDEARLGRQPEVKNFAAKTLPTMQEHEKMAEDMQATVKK
jgi:putative membrane protein